MKFFDFLVGLMLAVVLFSFGSMVGKKLYAQDEDRSYCQVTVGYGFLTFGSRCHGGQVMTGYDAERDAVYCADIQVNCQ